MLRAQALKSEIIEQCQRVLARHKVPAAIRFVAGAGGLRCRQARAAPMRNVIITGGSRGLGFSIAIRLRDAGYRVDRRRPQGKRRDRRQRRPSRRALHFWPCDLADIDAIPALVKKIRGDVGPIYGLVNNAGHRHQRRARQDARRRHRAPGAAQHRFADGDDQACRARDDGRWRRRADREHLLDRRLDRVQRALGLWRDQGIAGRLHQVSGARGRAARDHRQRGRARLCRHRDDRGHGRRPARPGDAPQPAATGSPRPRTSPTRSNSCSATRRATSPVQC